MMAVHIQTVVGEVLIVNMYNQITPSDTIVHIVQIIMARA